jgi:uncharacterized membrane protein (UPF0127 family)
MPDRNILLGAKALVLALCLVQAAVVRAEFPVVELGAGMHRIEAELAHTDPNRQKGLMHRQAMPVHRGMVFVFTQDARHCMWMKNTLIPLSVAFMDREGRILNIEDMQPQTEDSHCAAAPARFALEMNKGWFAERGISLGARIRGIDRLPPPR